MEESGQDRPEEEAFHDIQKENKCTKKDETNEKALAEMKMFEKIRSIMVKEIPRQKPKSGKFWKEPRAEFRSLKKDRGKKKTFEERMRLKEAKQKNNELAKALLQDKIERKQNLRLRIEENKKRREERQLKNEVFQIVRNPNKIKKIKKKDLAKRDIL